MGTYHSSGASGSALAVGISWIFLWYMSYTATKEYHEPFLWKNFFKNLIFCTMLTAVLWIFYPRDIEIIGRLGYILSLVAATAMYAL
jgi:hypothetical protein